MEFVFISAPCRCPVADCVSWALPAIGLVLFSCLAGDELAVSSSRPVSCDGNLGSDFLWGFFAEFDGVDFFTPFWGTFSSRLGRAGWSDIVFSSISGVDLFLERPSFGDLALVGGIYNKYRHTVSHILSCQRKTSSTTHIRTKLVRYIRLSRLACKSGNCWVLAICIICLPVHFLTRLSGAVTCACPMKNAIFGLTNHISEVPNNDGKLIHVN